MGYIAVRFDAGAAEADAWSDALVLAGALSADVSDPRAGTPHEAPLYGEPWTLPATAWETSRVVALFPAGADWDGAMRAVAGELELPMPACESYAVAEEDWVRQTQAQFGPIEIAPRFWIVPSWSEAPDPGAQNLRLDPGLAFGTGSHPTTRLCLRWLRETIAGGESVLDYGCGSGILAIGAARLGAGQVTGVDVDPQALRASESNARLNGVAAAFFAPDALPAGRFARVVANILANPLIVLAPAISACVAARGRLALSGILAPQARSVIDAYAPWITLVTWETLDGWVLLTGEQP